MVTKKFLHFFESVKKILRLYSKCIVFLFRGLLPVYRPKVGNDNKKSPLSCIKKALGDIIIGLFSQKWGFKYHLLSCWKTRVITEAQGAPFRSLVKYPFLTIFHTLIDLPDIAVAIKNDFILQLKGKIFM